LRIIKRLIQRERLSGGIDSKRTNLAPLLFDMR